MKQNKKNVTFSEKKPGALYQLLYKEQVTPVSIERSHEGYNHFSQWVIKVHNTVETTAKTQSEAFTAAKIVFYAAITKIIVKEGI